MPLWARLTVLLAGTKAALGLVLYLAGSGDFQAASVVPVWVFAALTAAFAVVGFMLVAGNRSDHRAAWLGGVLVLIAAALAPGVNRATAELTMAVVVRPEALLPAFFWRFVGEFPSRLAGSPGRAVRQLATAALAMGTVCLVTNLSQLWWPTPVGEDWRGPLLVNAPSGAWYWPIVFGLSALALPVLSWRVRAATPDERPRVRIFVRGLALGLTPFALEVLAEALIPAYDAFTSRELVRDVIGTVLFGALALVPFLTAYSVLFDRVMETRVVLRAALQHMLARYTIATLAVVPFAALAVVLYSHRDQPLTTLFAGPRPPLLLGAAVLGLLAQVCAPDGWTRSIAAISVSPTTRSRSSRVSSATCRPRTSNSWRPNRRRARSVAARHRRAFRGQRRRHRPARRPRHAALAGGLGHARRSAGQ